MYKKICNNNIQYNNMKEQAIHFSLAVKFNCKVKNTTQLG